MTRPDVFCPHADTLLVRGPSARKGSTGPKGGSTTAGRDPITRRRDASVLGVRTLPVRTDSKKEKEGVTHVN